MLTPLIKDTTELLGSFLVDLGLDSVSALWYEQGSYCWRLLCLDASVLQARLESHADAVWDLSAHSTLPHILSCSADGSVKLWAPHSSKALLSDFVLDASKY